MNGKVASIVALSAVFLRQLVYFYPQMPVSMASHFNGSGQPNGWMPKNGFFLFEIGLLLFCLFLFVATTRFLKRLPDDSINLPHKEYWLAPERRDATLESLQGQMEAFHVSIFLLLVAINHLVFRANLFRQDLPVVSWLLVGAFVLYTVIWSIHLFRRFKATARRNP